MPTRRSIYRGEEFLNRLLTPGRKSVLIVARSAAREIRSHKNTTVKAMEAALFVGGHRVAIVKF